MQVKLGKIPHFKIGHAIRFPANIINTHIINIINIMNNINNINLLPIIYILPI